MEKGVSLSAAVGTGPQPAVIAGKVAAAARMVAAEGLVEAFGHVSARIAGSSFVITPRKGLASVSADELLGVGMPDGIMRVNHGDPSTLPVEAVIHAAIYLARSDVDGIVRDHGEASTVFGVSGQSLQPVHALGAVGLGGVPIFDSSDLISDRAGGDDLCSVLGDSSAVLLRGNGRVVVGASVEEAFARAVLLEESARIQLAARSAGLDARLLTSAEQECAVRDLANPGQIRRVWDHYYAKHGIGTLSA